MNLKCKATKCLNCQWFVVGEVLLDKVPTAKTVVNKLGQIDNTYRNFAMEILAGEDNMVTTTKEEGISYEFDFSKVYWNPRLGLRLFQIVDGNNRKHDPRFPKLLFELF